METDDTATTAFLIGWEKEGARRAIYALFESAESNMINTGYGARSRRVVTTETVASDLGVVGHGQVSIVPQSTLDTLLAAVIMNGKG